MKRQALVTRSYHPAGLEVLLHESALHRVVGGPKVMNSQLRHVAEVSKLSNVTVRIHPYRAGLTWGMGHGGFIILEFDDDSSEPPVVYMDGAPSPDVYLEKPDEVRHYGDLASDIRASCLGESESRSLLRRAGKEL